MKKPFNAKRLRELRLAAELSIRELARRANVPQPYLSRLESGEKDSPGWDVVCRLADVLGVALEEFR